MDGGGGEGGEGGGVRDSRKCVSSMVPTKEVRKDTTRPESRTWRAAEDKDNIEINQLKVSSTGEKGHHQAGVQDLASR